MRRKKCEVPNIGGNKFMVYYEKDELCKMYFYTQAFYDLTIKYDIDEFEEFLFMLNKKHNNDVKNRMLKILNCDYPQENDARKCIIILYDFSFDKLFCYDTTVRDKFIFTLKKVFDQIIIENSY